ncbi:MAG: A/G-specific adenine glycosylase [Thermoleophilia bacterium]|nr:A/G-specific adenine glycosylase [Thermoleophilia bacterium]
MTDLIQWFGTAGEDLPWRRTRDRYAVLVAETQLQATPVRRVVPYYVSWMERWPTAAALARASVGDVLAAWHGLGYPLRARRLHEASRVVAERGWPADDRMTDLPGVGAYTAAALRCFADEADVLPVDTNVRRVMARRFPGGWPGTPPGRAWAAGQALMDLGRLWCTNRAPRCDGGCPVRAGCPAADAGNVADVTPPLRRQGRYEGSMRQRRGTLMGALARGERVRLDDDPDASASLVHDGLAARDGRWLVRAGHA